MKNWLHRFNRGAGLIFRPQRDVTWAYVGGVFGALGGRLPFPVYDVFGGVFGALGGRLPFRVCDVFWAYVGGVFGALGGRLPFLA